MKKIGIVTYQRATNYGAVLQSYSLYNRIRNIGDEFELEIIDYSTAAARTSHIQTVALKFLRGNISFGFDEWQKNIMFEKFSNSLPLSEKKIVSDSIGAFNNYVNSNYDIVIVGSDAVYSWNGKKFPTAYFLHDIDKCKKMSYAASAHSQKYKSESSDRIKYCGEALRSYEYLGVRDTETERFVKFCGYDGNVFHNCDPTLLLELDKIKKQTDTASLLERNGIDPGKPLILIMSGDEETGKAVVEKYSSEYQIVSLFVNNKAVKKHLPVLTPFEWATVFSYASLTVTQYFHATILSLLNRTPVVSIDKTSAKTEYEGKIGDLLCTRLGLPEYYLNIDTIREKGISVLLKMCENNLSSDLKSRIESGLEKESSCFSSFETKLKNILAE